MLNSKINNMEKYIEWNEELSLYLILAIESNLISDFDDSYNLPITEDVLNNSKINMVTSCIIDFYKMFDGFKLEWSDTAGDLGGCMHFLKMEEVLQNWKGNLYDEDDLEENDLIEFFHPFDLITPEAQCGIMIGMEYEDHEIHYNYSGTAETLGLDVDFEGYLEMAKEARIFFYWPKVLLDIQNKEENPETLSFKKNMPKIFPDFKWENFVAKYESLRLSKQ